MPSYSNDVRSKAISLYSQGKSLAQISKALGPARSTVSRWVGSEVQRGGWATATPSSLFESLHLNIGEPGDPYTTHPVVYRCVSLLSRNIAGVPLQLYTGHDDDADTVDQGPWYDLFLKPNPYMTRRVLWEATSTHLLRDGEVFWALEGATDAIIGDGEMPSEIYPIAGRYVTEILDEDQRDLLGWQFQLPTGSVTLPREAVIQFKLYDPDNPWRGLSPMSAAMAGFRQDSKASNYNEAFFENGADPGGVLTSDQAIANDQREALRKAWNDRHAGGSKAYRTAVLGNGMKYEPISTNHRDMQFLEMRRFNERTIAQVYGVPLWFLMDSQDLNYATARSAERILWETTIIPLLRSMEDTLEAQLFSTRDSMTDNVEWASFDLSNVEALDDNLEVKLLSATSLFNLGIPMNQINERLKLGLELQPEGDIGLLPMGLAPVEDVVDGGDFGDLYGPIEPMVEEAVAEESVEPIRMSRDQARRQKRWQRIASNAFDPVEKRFRKRLGAYIHGRRAEVLKALANSTRAAGDDLEQYLIDAQARWDEQLKEQVNPIYKYAVEKGAESIGEELGGLKFFNMSDPAVTEFMAEKELLLERVNQTILKQLRQTLVEGIDQAETMRELQDRVRETFNTTRARAATIARTESAIAVNSSRAIAMEAEGVEKVEWVSSNDHKMRPSHAALDGEVRAMGDSFLPNVTLRHPGDVRCSDPSEIINCRCSMGPAALD